jgi:hypothetical protein
MTARGHGLTWTIRPGLLGSGVFSNKVVYVSKKDSVVILYGGVRMMCNAAIG